MKKKKTYRTPRMTVHGSVATLTNASNQANSDSPAGTPNSAWPSHS